MYDEFGNVIGDDDDDDDDEEPFFSSEPQQQQLSNLEDDKEEEDMMVPMEDETSRAVVLHEDKEYYQTAEEVYPGAATVVLDEDAQPLSEPILKPVKVRKFSTLDDISNGKISSTAFLQGLMGQPETIRTVALVGSLHSGKTTFADVLTTATFQDPPKIDRYADTREDERRREMSIKSTPLSLVLPDSRGKHFLVNAIDCPGHGNFIDEVAAALRLADGCCLIIDAVEGMTKYTEALIRRAIADRVDFTLVVNKVDRLILELKLPPTDAYFKLVYTIDEVNAIIQQEWHAAKHRFDDDKKKLPILDPRRGNVVFASAQHSWCFSLESFARAYLDDAKYNPRRRRQKTTINPDVNPGDLAKRLWGDLYFDDATGRFSKTPPKRQRSDDEDDSDDAPVDYALTSSPRRSFVEFVLEPMYKIYSQVIGEEPSSVGTMMLELGTRMTRAELTLDAKPLLKVTFQRFFKDRSAAAFVDLVSRHCRSPKTGNKSKVLEHYAGVITSPLAAAMMDCQEDGPLVIHVAKMYSTPDATSFLSLGRIYSGVVKVGTKVQVLGEAYTSEDPEDARPCVISGVSVSHGRHRSVITEAAGPGNLVLLEGVDGAVQKTATLVDMEDDESLGIFRPPRHPGDVAVIKLAVEPLNPAELPKMTDGLRKISKSYPLATTKVEESGEHVIFGTGELYMDCVMRDLREMYASVEIKVADPVVSFRETVAETSSLKCFSETPNKRNKLTMIAEPLDEGLCDDVERYDVNPSWPTKQLGAFMQANYDWDLLAARSIWAFGPDSDARKSIGGCANVLVDDTLPSEVDKRLLNLAKVSIVQGFQWGCREGPLCDEPVRNCKFKILDAIIADQPLHRGGGQLIPTARRVCYSSFLMAAPRLMEPIFAVEIQCPADCVSAVYPVLARRRGHVVRDAPKPGSPFYVVHAYLPAIDSFGFETDLRAFTSGMAMCSQSFDHWAVCPGDPLDRSIILAPLEPSPPPHLAREFMVKTRRRKGLAEDVAISKYFDDNLLKELAMHHQDLGGGGGL